MPKKIIKIDTENPEMNDAIEKFVNAMVEKFKKVDHKHGDRSVVRKGYVMHPLDKAEDGIYQHLRQEMHELSLEMIAEKIDSNCVMGEAVDVGNMAFLLFWKGMKS
jgi:hypothetical protein